jgi:DNA-binding transcriptional ArsR family regulator
MSNRKISRTLEGEASLLRTLGHPTRLQILRILMEEDQCVKNIWERLGLNQANVSQHLTIMKHQGILRSERKGGRMCYAIEDKRVLRLLDLLRSS